MATFFIVGERADTSRLVLHGPLTTDALPFKTYTDALAAGSYAGDSVVAVKAVVAADSTEALAKAAAGQEAARSA